MKLAACVTRSQLSPRSGVQTGEVRKIKTDGSGISQPTEV